MVGWISKLGRWFGVGAARKGAVLAVAAAGVVTGMRAFAAPVERAGNFTDLATLARAGGVEDVRIEGERVTARTADGTAIVATVTDAASRHDLVEAFAKAGTPVSFEADSSAGERVLGALGPAAAVLLVGGVFYAMQRRRGRAQYTPYRNTGAGIGFDDVAGIDEAKDALRETVELLRDPEKFGRLGGRAPRGVLLTGEPGTGKTLLAKAVAAEAGVPFFSASGAAFQEMFVGVGAARVRALFAEARRAAPCVVFIDEIDALARARSHRGDAATAEHDQTLNQLLVEMDGFDPRTGIVVIASTNRPDVLDPAMLRPGRFDRHVVVPLPDLRGRTQILAVHARPVELADGVDLHAVARGTPGFSGAELANLLNEAAILAAREGALGVDGDHLDRARDRVLMGAERRGFEMDPVERHATAVHEAGHVAVAMAAPTTDPVHKVSILPRGRALGVTQALPERDRWMFTKEHLEDQVCMMLGGRAAEIEVLGTMTAGASDDLLRATGIVRRMVGELGMSPLGPMSIDAPGSRHSEAMVAKVEETTRSILEHQMIRARRFVRERRAEIGRLVTRLLADETLDAAAIRHCFPADARARDARRSA